MREIVFNLGLAALGCLQPFIAYSVSQSAVQWEEMEALKNLQDTAITSIAPTESAVLFGTRRGLGCFDRKAGKIKFYLASAKEADSTIWTLLPDGNRVWIGTNDGMALWENGALASLPFFLNFKHTAVKTFARSQESLWIGTTTGLWEYALRDQTLKEVGNFSKQSISQLAVNGQFLLVLVSDQLVWMNLKTRDVKSVKLEFNPLGNPVTAMTGSGDYIWFATDGSSLIGYNLVLHEWYSLGRSAKIGDNLAALANNGDYYVRRSKAATRYDS